jgi:aspartate/methionine/tyrosine aminotransferase
MSPQPSSIVTALPASGIRRMMAKAAAMEGVSRLDVGEPQFATPAHIVEAAALAAEQGATKYAPSGGLLSTRDAIAAAIAADTGTPVTRENVVVTVGAVGALISAVRTAVEPGDEVLVPDPGWPNYMSLVRVSGAEPVRYALDSEHGFSPTRAQLETACTPRTRAVLVNTPGNPTGAVFSPATMEDVLAFARDHDLYVISDEVYSKIVYEPPFTSAWGLGEDERVIVANSVSKTYSMTGWRLGWALAEPSVVALIAKLQEAYISCSPSLSQKAVETALSGDQSCIATFREAYSDNLDIAVEELRRGGIACRRSAGSFYLWVDVGCEDSWAFADRLLEERRVAVAPGEAFGEQGKGHVRLSLASSEDQVRRGARELADFRREQGGGR